MKSDIPDELFVFPDSHSLTPRLELLSSEADSVFTLTQEDIDDMSVDASFPLRNPNFGPVIDDLPF